jgi:hypothetical protein
VESYGGVREPALYGERSPGERHGFYSYVGAVVLPRDEHFVVGVLDEERVDRKVEGFVHQKIGSTVRSMLIRLLHR